MFRGLKYVLGLVAASFIGINAADAASVSFNKSSGGTSTAWSFTFTGSDGTQVTATAKGGGNPQKVARDTVGLGVKSGLLDSTQLDNLLPSEYIYLVFDKAVEITCITFGNVGYDLLECKNDEYMLYADGTFHSSGEIPGGTLLDNGYGTVYFNNLGPVTTLKFATTDWNDAYKIRSICYNTPTPIPLPPAAWSGLAMMGALCIPGATRRIRTKLAGQA